MAMAAAVDTSSLTLAREPAWTRGCVAVEALSVVLFQCRSLERILSEQVIILQGEPSTGAPLAQDQSAVNGVLAEFPGGERRDTHRRVINKINCDADPWHTMCPKP